MTNLFCGFCSTGWLSRWGEKMANTNFNKFLEQLLAILQYNDNTGSVNLYMAHGGTNFGWTAGAHVRLPAPIVPICHCPNKNIVPTSPNVLVAGQ